MIPIGTIVVGLIVFLSAVYFITSCDSGTPMITTILSLGDEEPPIRNRIAGGLVEGVIAGVLLGTGGLAALQAATIAAVLPFSIMLLVIIVGLVKALREEPAAPRTGVRSRAECENSTGCCPVSDTERKR